MRRTSKSPVRAINVQPVFVICFERSTPSKRSLAVQRDFVARGLFHCFLERTAAAFVPRPVERIVAQRGHNGPFVVRLLIECDRSLHAVPIAF